MIRELLFRLVTRLADSRRSYLCNCACGLVHSKDDRRTTRVGGEDHEARLFGNHGPLYDLICRSCRRCGAVYALDRAQDESLPP
jgi:hypothetical protein